MESTKTTTTKSAFVLVLFLVAFLVGLEGWVYDEPNKGDHVYINSDQQKHGESLFYRSWPYGVPYCVLFPGYGPYGGYPGYGGIPKPGGPKHGDDGSKPCKHDHKNNGGHHGDHSKGDGGNQHDQVQP